MAVNSFTASLFAVAKYPVITDRWCSSATVGFFVAGLCTIAE